MKKLSNTEAELKKALLIKKACSNSHFKLKSGHRNEREYYVH